MRNFLLRRPDCVQYVKVEAEKDLHKPTYKLSGFYIIDD
jgi:hypothetical protein